MSIRAVLFDLDGTLLDTLSDLSAALNDALSASGLPRLPEGEIRAMIGHGAAHLAFEAVRRARTVAGMPGTGEGGSLPDPRDVLLLFQENYRRDPVSRTRAYPGITAALAALSDAGVGLGVLSNKPHEFVVSLVDRFFPGLPFVCVFGERPGIPRKPDPAAAAESLSRLGVDAGAVAYVGDAGSDMAFARACGFLPVGVLWGFRPARELEEGGAVRCFSEPARLAAWILGDGGSGDS